MTAIEVGDHVVHSQSGWAGTVTHIAADDGGAGQGPLVTVRPTHPRPADASEDWQGWRPITVTADELIVEGK